MNSLTWAIYLIGVIPQFTATLVGILIGLIVATSIFGFIRHMVALEHHQDFEDYINNKGWQSPIKYIIGMLAAIVVLQLVPSERTLYMMVGSEVAEMAATSSTGQELLNEVKETLMYKLEEIKGEQNNDK